MENNNFWDILDEAYQSNKLIRKNSKWHVKTKNYPKCWSRSLKRALWARRYRISEQIIQAFNLPIDPATCAMEADFSTLRIVFNENKPNRDIFEALL